MTQSNALANQELFPILTSLPDIKAPDPFVLSLQGGMMVCAAVYAAVTLGLPDLLADEPQTVQHLAQATQSHAPSLYLLLRALSRIGIFTETDADNQIFAPTKRSLALRSTEMADLVKLWGAGYQWDAWKSLAYTIQTGHPGLEAVYGKGTTIWSYLSQHPDEARIFQRGLTVNADLLLPALLASCDFTTMQCVVDVGGGQGRLCLALLERYPHLMTTLFDRKEVIVQVEQRVLPAEIASRFACVAGNFFEVLPPGADGYLLKNVLMDWSDQNYIDILQCCARAMHAESRVLIIEPLITPHATFTPFFSLQMAVMMHAARHRSLEEHLKLASAAGFSFVQAVPLGLEQMLLEFTLTTHEKEHML